MRVQGMDVAAYLMTDIEAYKGRRVNELLTHPNEEGKPVQVTISEEGVECYRNNLLNLKESVPDELVNMDKDREIMGKLLIDIVGTHYSSMGSIVSKLNDQKVVNDVDAMAKSYLEAYAAKYDEITKGYEDGTREIWVVDSSYLNGEADKDCTSEILVSSGGLRIRKLTKEEELAALNKAYDSMVKIYEISVEQKQIVDKVKIAKDKLTAKIMGKTINDTTTTLPKKVDNFYEKMMKANEEFITNYSSNREETLKGILSIIDKVFKHT